MKHYSTVVRSESLARSVLNGLWAEEIPFVFQMKPEGWEFAVKIEYRSALNVIVHKATTGQDKPVKTAEIDTAGF